MLPSRSIEEEDAFLLRMVDASPDLVIDAISAALEQKRPILAARLIELLDDDQLEMMEPEERERARRGARLILMEKREDPNAWYYEAQELAVLWHQTNRRRVARIKDRMRGKNRHKRPRMPRKR